jgi:hypothetical protein
VTHRTNFAAGAVARLHILPEPPGGYPYAVMLARPPVPAEPAAMMRRGEQAAVLTHAEGRNWPDRRGEALAAAVMERGGVVMFAFRALSDALGCKQRLEGGAR